MIIGIDPGLSGAYALLTDAYATVGDLPIVNKHLDAAEFLRIIKAQPIDLAIVEAVTARPGNGSVSSFTFGRCYGAILATLACAGLRTITVPPAVWKRRMNLSADKERSRARAIMEFPQTTGLSRRRDEGRAEALLLALYAKTQETKNNAST
jgi:crossover junction endodeoxyribonuclease RuvC